MIKSSLKEANKTKHIECDKCGKDGKIFSHLPLRFSRCAHCGSLKIRLYRPVNDKRIVDEK